MSVPIEVTPTDVKQRLDAGERMFLIDVREPYEALQANIAGSELIPMRTVPANLQQIEGMSDNGPIIVFCHHGMRSFQACMYLQRLGFAKTHNLQGGIDAWARDVEPGMARY